MWKKNSILLFLLFITNLYIFGQTQNETPRTVSEIMQDIKTQVIELESLSESRLQIIENDKTNIEKLETENNNIKENLNSLLTELSNANETIIRQDEKIKTQRKILATISIVLGAFFISHIVILILKMKCNITLPYWLNTLL